MKKALKTIVMFTVFICILVVLARVIYNISDMEKPVETSSSLKEVKTTVVQATIATTEFVTEIMTESFTEIVTEPAEESTTKAVTEPTEESATEIVTEVTGESTTEVVTKITEESTTEPITEVTVESTAEPVTETTTKSEVESTTRQTSSAVTQPETTTGKSFADIFKEYGYSETVGGGGEAETTSIDVDSITLPYELPYEVPKPMG